MTTRERKGRGKGQRGGRGSGRTMTLRMLGSEEQQPSVVEIPSSPLMSTDDVQRDIYGGKMTRWWITHRFCPDWKIVQSRECFWPRDKAWEWVLKQRGNKRGAA